MIHFIYAALLLAVFDFFSGMRHLLPAGIPGFASIPMLFVYCVGSAALAGILLGVIDGFLKKIRREAVSASLAALALLLIPVIGENLPQKISQNPQFLIKTLIGAAVIGASGGISYYGRRTGRFRIPVMVYALASAAALMLLDMQWRPGEYFFIHLFLKTALLLHLACFIRFILPDRHDGFRGLRATLCISALCLFLFSDASQAAKAWIYNRSVFSGPVLQTIKTFLDLDRDGYSRLLGGGDPDDFDASRFPGKAVAGESQAAAMRKDQYELRGTMIRKPNILFVVLCSCRKDHLGLYGYSRPTTPFLSRLAKEAIVFDNAYTPYPRTTMAVASLMTGRHSAHFLYTDKGQFDRYLSWPEIMRANGYKTMAFLPSAWFDRGVFWRHAFDEYDNEAASALEHKTKKLSTAERVVDRALSALKKESQRPLFMFFLLFDPHEDYMAHPEFMGEDKSGKIARYDSEIRYMDHHLGRLVDTLGSMGLSDDLWICVVGDHGEEFHDHGGTSHGSKIYNELMQVPFMIKIPGQGARLVKQPVSTSDMLPTLMDLLGQKNLALDGASLRHLIDDNSASSERPIFLAGQLRRGILQDGYKLIYDIKDNFYELYDLKSDPRETKNLYDAMPEKRKTLHRLLEQEMERLSFGFGLEREGEG